MAQASTSNHHSIPHDAAHGCSSASRLLHPPATTPGEASPASFLHRFCSVVFSPGKRPSPSTSPSQEKQQGLVHKPHRPQPPTLIVPAGDVAVDPREEVEYHFGRVFRYFDEDGDGKISPSELRTCMKTVGEELSEEDAEAVVESTDSDGDGLLGFEDFVRLVEVEGEEARTRDLREAFGMYATEGIDGCITPKSLRSMLVRLGEWKSLEECKLMIQRFDLNGDGVLSFDEFRLMML